MAVGVFAFVLNKGKPFKGFAEYTYHIVSLIGIFRKGGIIDIVFVVNELFQFAGGIISEAAFGKQTVGKLVNKIPRKPQLRKGINAVSVEHIIPHFLVGTDGLKGKQV